jgi:hypothetical protein
MNIARSRCARTVPTALAIIAMLALPARAVAAQPTVYSVRTGSAVTLSDSGGAPTTIESLVVPRGGWTVTSNVTAVDFGSGDFVRCQLQQNGTLFDGGATTYIDDTVADLTNSGVVKTTAAATTIALVCTHDQNAPTTAQFYLDAGATLMAVEGGPIKGAAAAASTGPNVVQKRTTAQTALGLSTSTLVEQMRVAAGTWVFHINLSIVNFGDFDFAGCTLFGPTGTGNYAQQQVAVGGDPDSVVSNIAMQGTRGFSKPATVKLACSVAYTQSVYIDPGATLIATRVAPADVAFDYDTKGVLPDTGGTQMTVFHQQMPAGSWRVSSAQTAEVSNPNHSIGGATDYVRCGLYAGNQPIDGGATVRISTGTDGGNYEQMIAEGGTHTAKKPWTLRVKCSHDATIATGSHWVVFSASPVVAIQQGPIDSSVI